MADRVQVQLRAQSPELLQALIRRMPLDLDCGGPRRGESGEVLVTAFVTPGDLEQIREAEGVEVVEAREVRAASEAEVGEGDRFEGGRVPPHGPGRKTPEDPQ